MKVLFFWEAVGGLSLEHRCNPYAGLLARELEKLDIHLELGDYDFERGWLEEKRADFEVLHLNWLDRFYRAENLEAALERYTRFAENLSFARSLGYRIVWTLHNFYPHERPFPPLDRLGRHLICRQADAVIAHCEHAAGLARKVFFRRQNLHVIPHGWNTAIGFAADLHFQATVNEDKYGMVEFWSHRTITDLLKDKPFALDDEGKIAVPTGAGLGVELDDTFDAWN